MTVNPTEHPVIDAIANRWSPYRFAPNAVPRDQLLSCLEAARWAPSSYNDQPWSWILAERTEAARFDKALGCLMEANRGWAADAGVLMFSVIRTTFKHGGKENRVALHDLGAAAGYLTLQAASLGLQVHQMAGVDLERVRREYAVPEGHEPQTALAIGYPANEPPVDDEGREMERRQSGPRQRIPLRELVFSDTFGQPAEIVAAA